MQRKAYLVVVFIFALVPIFWRVRPAKPAEIGEVDRAIAPVAKVVPPPAIVSPPSPPPPGASGIASPKKETGGDSLRDRLAISRTLFSVERELPTRLGFERVSVVVADFRYPLVRLVETGYREPVTGVEHITRTVAAVADHVVVRPRTGVSLDQIAQLAGGEGVRVRGRVPGTELVLLEFEVNDANALPTAVERLGAAKWVELAEPDGIVTTCEIPNDAAIGSGEQWSAKTIHAAEGWSIRTDASSCVVAITDTGIRLTHEDLAGNLWHNPGETGNGRESNGIDDDHNGYVDDVYGIDAVTGLAIAGDDHGHGTHVAGIAGAMGNNGKGIAGVAWRTQLMALKFITSRGVGVHSDAITCLSYARRHGARVINASWGGAGYSELLRQSIEACVAEGAVFVSAAGNNAADIEMQPFYPAGYFIPGHVTVASVNPTSTLSSFSNFGAVDIAAPGESILSAWNESDNSYRPLSGTSMAAPHVAGAIALLRAQFPSESPAALIRRLIAGSAFVPWLTNFVASGRRLDLPDALGRATFTALPSISVPPTVLASLGDKVELVASVEGPPPFTYTWRFEGVPIPGAQTDRLVFPNVGSLEAGSYSVVVANAAGAVTSRRILLSVIGAPTLIAQPRDAQVVAGNEAVFVVGARANGADRLQFQWLFNDAPLAGEVADSLRLTRVQANQAGRYRVTVSNVYGTTNSDDARLTVLPAEVPSFVGEPTDVTVSADDSAEFIATAKGTPKLEYVWLKDGVVLPDETGSTLRIDRAQVADGGAYRVKVANSAGAATSRAANLTVRSVPVAPFIVEPPIARTVYFSRSTQLSARAKGTPTPTLQWRHDGIDVPGATNSQLTITKVSSADAGQYTLVATNALGSVTSPAAILTVETAFGQEPWTWRSPLPQGNDLMRVTTFNDTHIVVGQSGTILTSPDGLAWTIRASGVKQNLTGIATGAGHVVAVGGGGTILRSDDAGSNWTAFVSGVSGGLFEIVYGNGIFVAVGDAGVVLTSVDGRTWTRRTSGTTAQLTGLTFGGGRFVATSASGVVLRSTNGVSWTASSIPSTGWSTISYGNGIYVVAFLAAQIYTSTDGEHWTFRFRDTGFIDRIEYVVDRFYGLRVNGQFLTSVDGVNWTVQPTGYAGFPYGLTYANGRYLLVGEGGAVVTSSDGATWTQRTGGAIRFYDSVAWGAPGFVACDGGTAISYSRTGVLWAKVAVPGVGSIRSVIYANAQYVALAGKNVITSDDGLQWTIRGTLIENPVSIAYGDGMYVVVGVGKIVTSPDLQTWTPRISGTTQVLNCVRYAGAQFIAGGNAGTILTSKTGEVWDAHSVGRPDNIRALAYGDGRYAAGGDTRSVFWSDDGVTWAQAGPELDIFSGLSDVIFAQDHFIAIGYGGALATSVDGKSWLLRSSGTARPLSKIAASDRSLVIVGGGETILQSSGFEASPQSLAPSPGRQLVFSGDTIHLELNLTGETLPPLQWLKDGVAVPDATLATLDIPGATSADAGAYTLRVGDAKTGEVSQTAYVAIATAQGTGTQIPLRGGNVHFTVTSPPEFGWSAGSGASWIGVVGQTSRFGSDTIAFSVAPNLTGVSRSGYIVVGGTSHLFEQAGARPPDSRLVNITARGFVNNDGLTVGTVVVGSGLRRVLIRAAGPALDGYQVDGALRDPRLLLVPQDRNTASNDDWEIPVSDVTLWSSRVGAFPFASGSRDAALVASLPPGNHTAIASGKGQEGIAMLEIYEATAALEELIAGRLVNLSARARVGPGPEVLIAGFVVTGREPQRVLIRGVGPGLKAYGVSDALRDPYLTLFQKGRVVAQNDNWDSPDGLAIADESKAAGAFALQPGSGDAALLVLLEPGAYTVHVTAPENETGAAMVEVYDVN